MNCEWSRRKSPLGAFPEQNAYRWNHPEAEGYLSKNVSITGLDGGRPNLGLGSQNGTGPAAPERRFPNWPHISQRRSFTVLSPHVHRASTVHPPCIHRGWNRSPAGQKPPLDAVAASHGPARSLEWWLCLPPPTPRPPLAFSAPTPVLSTRCAHSASPPATSPPPKDRC